MLTTTLPPLGLPAAGLEDDTTYVVTYTKPGTTDTSVALCTLAARAGDDLPADVVRVQVERVLSSRWSFAYHGANTSRGSSLLVDRSDVHEATPRLLEWADELTEAGDVLSRHGQLLRDDLGCGGYSTDDKVVLILEGTQVLRLAERLGIDLEAEQAVEA